jgi:hypothetical protein
MAIAARIIQAVHIRRYLHIDVITAKLTEILTTADGSIVRRIVERMHKIAATHTRHTNPPLLDHRFDQIQP